MLRQIHAPLYKTPPSPASVLLAPGKDDPQPWRYKTTPKPTADWFALETDDSTWSSGTAPFGNTKGPHLKVNTPMNAQILLRRKFSLDQVPKQVAIVAYGRGPVQVYLNGQLAKSFTHRGPRDGSVGVGVIPWHPKRSPRYTRARI